LFRKFRKWVYMFCIKYFYFFRKSRKLISLISKL
jgi:hypothetical protein